MEKSVRALQGAKAVLAGARKNIMERGLVAAEKRRVYSCLDFLAGQERLCQEVNHSAYCLLAVAASSDREVRRS